MRDTIKARYGYEVFPSFYRETGKPNRFLFDGYEFIIEAYPLTFREHTDKILGNATYHVCEVLTTMTGTQFIYSRDEETDTDYLVKIN